MTPPSTSHPGGIIPRPRIALVVNPASGGPSARRVARRVRPIFVEAGLEPVEIIAESSAAAIDTVRRLATDDVATVCAVGGDGTVNAVANGLMRRDDPRALALGVIPAGSGNALMRQFTLDPVTAARRIAAGGTHDIDVLHIDADGELRYAVNAIGWAMAGNGAAVAEALRFMGPSRYHIAALIELARARSHRAQLEIGDQRFDDEFAFLIACNSRFTGAGMLVAPRAHLDDGLVDLLYVGPARRTRLYSMFRRLKDGTHVDCPEVTYRQIESFRLDSDVPAQIMIDGDITRAESLHVSTLRGALRLAGDGDN